MFYLINIVVVDDAVKAFVDVVKHVHNLHGCAILAESGKANDVAEIYGHLFIQLRLHHAGLLKAFHHRASNRKTKEDQV